MNIIYLLTNTKNKTPRYYIGSKAECTIIKLNDIPTIISNKNNQPYYSSSTNIQFKEDFKNGDTFVASILEEVPDRSKLLEVENKYIIERDAVNSDQYYNLSYAVIGRSQL